MRTKVLGAAHVEKALKSAGDFERPFQQIATEAAWGDVWSRPGLDLKARELCSIAILAANGQLPEVKLHTMGAINVGATKEEISEVLMQVGVFCGFPAANAAARAVSEAIKEYQL